MATHKALPLVGNKYLNFSVVGGTIEPTNPKENTIWVKTNVPITSWSIDGRAPDTTNFVKSPFYSAAGTWNGITYTVSGNSLTVNGTATQETYFFFRGKDVNDALPLNKGVYTINGCPVGGVHGSTYSLEFGVSYDGCTTWEYAVDYGSGATMYVSEGAVAEAVFIIYSGTTVNNLTISPQLKKISSSDTEPTVGQIQIKTLNSNGVISFNALKTNMIDTHLDSVYQWDGSEWLPRYGFVRQDNDFIQFSIGPTDINTLSNTNAFYHNGGHFTFDEHGNVTGYVPDEDRFSEWTTESVSLPVGTVFTIDKVYFLPGGCSWAVAGVQFIVNGEILIDTTYDGYDEVIFSSTQKYTATTSENTIQIKLRGKTMASRSGGRTETLSVDYTIYIEE